jgi:tetratricopeptide (TPR) repeat protein
LFEGEMAITPSITPASPAGHPGSNDRWRIGGICVLLVAITWSVFGQTLRHEFVNYDDNEYVYENPTVIRGLDLNGVDWAFTHIVAYNWHPLTMISHMLDCQMYGLNSGGHHLTNVLLHAASVVLLFLALREMTGALWRSAFVAAVFAVHPLRVESVAWVAERKDVLSGMFFMLTLWAYVRYARQPWSPLRYGVVVFLFVLGLMCKAMLVTLPFVLLLLDYWPLNRLHADDATTSVFRWAGKPISRRLVYEKLPLFGVALASGLATVFTFAPMQIFDQNSLLLRLGNASILYAVYLGKMFWPSNLAVLYPFEAGNVGVGRVALSLVVLAGISAAALVLRRHRPYLLAGWLWYLVMLGPVIGILRVGAHAQADRYTYLPQIGLYFALTWLAEGLFANWRHRRIVLGSLATVILIALIASARTQTAHWRNSESLWKHTLACTSNNFIAHDNLGNDLRLKGDIDEAAVHFREALRINPHFAEAHINLGNVLLRKGSVDDAIAHYEQALRIKPQLSGLYYNLGNALIRKGRVNDAIRHYRQALQIDPEFADAHNNLGNALLQQRNVDDAITHLRMALQLKPDYAEAWYGLGKAQLQKGNMDEAIDCHRQALQLRPDYTEVHNNVGLVLVQKGRVDEAIVHYEKALEIEPDNPQTLNNLAWVRAAAAKSTFRDGAEAVRLAERACRVTNSRVPVMIGTLAAAYAEAGRFDEAVAAAEKARDLALALGQREVAEKNEELIKLFKTAQPYHEQAH